MMMKPQCFLFMALFVFLWVLPLSAETSNNAKHTLTNIIVNNDVSKGWVSFEFDSSDGKPPIRRIEQQFPDRIIITLPDTKLGGDLRNGLFYEKLFCSTDRGINRLIVKQLSDPPGIRMTLYLNQDLDSFIESLNNTVATLRLVSDDMPLDYAAPILASEDGITSPSDELDELIFRKVHEDLKSSGPDIDKQINTLEQYIHYSNTSQQEIISSEPVSKYRIQSGDSLEIFITDEPDFRASVKVRPDGYITYQLLGDVIAEGLTPYELSMILKSRLMGAYFNYEIALTVSVIDYVPSRVYLIGGTPQPGPIEYTKGMTVLDTLGHFEYQNLDLSNVAVIRKGEGRIPVNVEEILKGDIDQNIELLPNDYILVPPIDFVRVMVFGKVRLPGLYNVQDDARIFDAVAVAGGFANRCDIRHIFVLREHGDSFERIELDLRQFKDEVDETQNIALQDRDIIFIPEVGRVDWDNVLRTLQQSSMVFYDFRRTLDY